MSRLSANTLFHFTSTKDNLLNIIKNGFHPRYCVEEASILPSEKWLVPMTCFSDIPLSQIGEHSSWYGKYAIGLSKEWGIKHNINPVLYINEDNPLIKMIKECIEYALRNIKSLKGCSEEKNVIINLTHQYSFYKPYMGIQYNKEKNKYMDKRFYDEREWRYVPQDQSKTKSLLKPYSEDFDTNQNKSLIPYRIFPDYQDINYIIVSTEGEILEMVDFLKVLEDESQDDHIRKLVTRVISMERIIQDF